MKNEKKAFLGNKKMEQEMGKKEILAFKLKSEQEANWSNLQYTLGRTNLLKKNITSSEQYLNISNNIPDNFKMFVIFNKHAFSSKRVHNKNYFPFHLPKSFMSSKEL